MRIKKLLVYVLLPAIILSLIAGCGAEHNAATDTSLSQTQEETVTEPATEETTASTTAPDGELVFNYICVPFEGRIDIEQNDDLLESIAVETREELLHLYDDYELGLKKKVKEYFTDAFFEEHTIIVITTSKRHNHFYNIVASLERKNGVINIEISETTMDKNEVVYGFYRDSNIAYRYQTLIILNKSDYNVEEINANLSTEYKAYKEIGPLATADYERSLAALEKYKP